MGTTFAAGRTAGGFRPVRALGILLVATVLLGPGQIARADHQTRDGLYTETHYIGVQFAYQFQWEAPWEADLETIASEEGRFDRLIVRGPDAEVRVLLRFEDDLDQALSIVMGAVGNIDEDFEVVGRDEGEDDLGLPFVAATLAYEGPGLDGEEVRLIEYVEVGQVFANDGSGGIRVVSLVAPAEDLLDAYEEVQATFVPNLGMTGPFFAGQPAGEDEDGGRERADDGGGDDSSSRGALDGGTYESPTFGYTLEWDAAVWEATETSEDGADTLILKSRGSSLYFIAAAGYDGDPEACVEDWADYLSSGDGVDDWEPLEDEDGEPVAGARRTRAWAAFTLTYTSEDGDEFDNANYIECRTLVDDEAVLAIVHITSQDGYADEAEAVEEILDTIELVED